MSIAIIGMVDERKESLALIKQYIETKGYRSKLIDISIGTGSRDASIKADISSQEIALAGGTSADCIRRMLAEERDKATGLMAEGLGKKILELYQCGDLRGVIAVGGMTGSFISLSAMKLLPYGLPKLLISSIATMPVYARKLSSVFSLKDITVMHSVVDTVGMNPLVKNLIMNAAGAICGMVEAEGFPQKDNRPAIAVTEFGFCDIGAHLVRELLEDKFNVISFHSTGVGEKAAVDMVGQGMFDAFIDLVPAGFSEHLFEGNRAAGADRLDAGCQQKRPYFLTPCGFDMISCGPIQRRDEGDHLWAARNLSSRKIFIQDAMRVQARTSSEEMRTIAKEAAARLNGCQQKKMIKFFIPLRGFSSLSATGGALHDPDSDQAFIETLKEALDPDIEIVEVDTHINTPAFAHAIVKALHEALQAHS